MIMMGGGGGGVAHRIEHMTTIIASYVCNSYSYYTYLNKYLCGVFFYTYIASYDL